MAYMTQGLRVGSILFLIYCSGVSAQYENCTGHSSSISDGLCDNLNNNFQCGYDGGDCCRCTCIDGSGYTCNDVPLNCRNPGAPSEIHGCLEAPMVDTSCSNIASIDWLVNDTASASALAETVLCSGGTFHVEWTGNVVVNRTIHVANGTVLHVTGVDPEAGMDGSGVRRLFTVEDASLHVRNMIIGYGRAMVGGAITIFRSNLSLHQTLFTENAADYDGGALYAVDGSTIRWDGPAAFVSNRAGFRGGAVYVGVESVVLWEAEAQFLSNAAGIDGGALFVHGNSQVSWEAQASSTNNTADDDGGDIREHDDSSVSWQAETRLASNAAGNGRGALHLGPESIALLEADTTWVGNAAGSNGGSLYTNQHSNAFWDGQTSFTNNSAGSNGGAIYLEDNSSVSWAAATSFVGNAAGEDGGACHAYKASVAFWEAQSLFMNNSAGNNGGALVFDVDSHTSWNAETVFLLNTAGRHGGAVFIRYNSSATWEAHTFFTKNTGGECGGAVSLKTNSRVVWNGKTLFVGNTGGRHGGGLCVRVRSNASWAAETSFWGNTALERAGGAMFADGNCIVSWEAETSFVNNTSSSEGGALFVRDYSKASWQAKTSFISNNTTFTGGAIVATFSSNVSWREMTSFINNTATLFHGGALVVLKNSSAAWEAETCFVDNEAGKQGGALVVWEGSDASWVGKTHFTGNVAGKHGGAVFLWDLTGVSWSAETSFTGNIAFERGGAVYVWDNSDLYWDADTSFVDNVAHSDGGALHVRIRSRVSWEAVTCFINNTAGSDGGAAYIFSESDVNWKATTIFSGNTAFGDGGAIFIHSGGPVASSLVMNGTTDFLKNKCGGGGGAIFMAATVSVTHDTQGLLLSGNVAGTAGGAVSVSDVGIGPRFIDKRFEYNSAPVGGAVYVTSSGTAITDDGSGNPVENPTTFDGCEFVRNEAAGTGGAINSDAGLDVIKNTSFVGNIGRAGGALRLSGTVSLHNCSFIENTSAEDEGAAVSNVGFIQEMIGCTFLDNDFECEMREFLDFDSDNMVDGLIHDAICMGCDTQCEYCNASSTIPKCTEELPHTESAGGTMTVEDLIVDPGYWRVTKSSREVLACYNSNACLGGVTGAPEYCRDGYEGPYCAVCSEGYYGSLGHTCRRCSKNTPRVVGTVLIIIVVFFAFAVVFYKFMSVEHTRSGRVQLMASWRRRLLSLKIVITTWQIVTQFTLVANVTYPNIYQSFLDSVGILNFDLAWLLPVGCIVDLDFHNRLLISTLGPLVVLIILGIMYAIAEYKGRGWKHNAKDAAFNNTSSGYLSAVLLLTFLVYSSVSSILFQMFACDTLDKGTSFLRADYRIDCDSSKHRALQIYAACMLIVYTAGIPLLYATLLFWHCHVLMAKEYRDVLPVVKNISNLWKLYKPRHFYYELVECSRRVLLAGVVVFIFPNTTAQIGVAFMLSALFMMVCEVVQPYESSWDAWVSRMGHAIIFASMYLALMLRVDVSDEDTRSQRIYETILVFIHVVMVLTAVLEAVVVTCYWLMGGAGRRHRGRTNSAFAMESS